MSLYVAGDEPRASFHPYRLTAGALLADGDGGVLLGVSVANRLGVSIGDEVEVTMLLSAYPRLILDDGGYETYKLTVRGLVGFGGIGLRLRHAFLPGAGAGRRDRGVGAHHSRASITSARPRSPPPSTAPSAACARAPGWTTAPTSAAR